MHVCLLYAAYHVHNIYCIKVLSSIQLCLALKLTGLMASSLSRAGDHGIFGHPKPAVQACRIPRIFQGFWAILSFQNLSESFRSYHFCVFSMFAWTIRNRCSLSEVDPSMLPYLYRSPAIWASGRTRKLHIMSMEIAPSLHLPAASMCSCPKTDWSDSHGSGCARLTVQSLARSVAWIAVWRSGVAAGCGRVVSKRCEALRSELFKEQRPGRTLAFPKF